jgi:hypothetical protein
MLWENLLRNQKKEDALLRASYSTCSYVSLLPHSPQKLVPAGFFAPHFEHTFRPRGAPQLLQNLPEPAGLPHSGQMVCLCVTSPVKTWVLSAFCFMSVTIFSALAAATSVLSLGASSMQRPSCSFQSFSQTYLWHLGHRWKWPFASFCASSKACSCSLCHSGVMPSKRWLMASAPCCKV